MMTLRFLGFSGRGLSLELLVFDTKLFKIRNGAERDSILWPCSTWMTAYRRNLPHPLMKKLGLNCLGLLVKHSPSCMHPAVFAEAALCKGNVDEIADVDLNCAGTYPQRCEIILIFHCSFYYIITLVILEFWLVLAYDLLDDRCTIDVIITKFSLCCFN